MQLKFSQIHAFTGVKDKCIFCDASLDLVYTTFFGVYKPGIPLIHAKEQDNAFSFKFNFNSASLDIVSVGHINTLSNRITFESEKNEDTEIIHALDSLSSHVELQCGNKKCKMNYYICSNVFRFTYDKGAYFVQPFELVMECFTAGKLVVHNDFHYDTTVVYHREDDRITQPISVPMISFDNMDKDKILNRVKTLVTFS